MGNVEGSTIAERRSPDALRGYELLENGAIPVVHPPNQGDRAADVRGLLETGSAFLSSILGVEPPDLEALLVADEDWEGAPRETARPYPRGLPYFTRSVEPPALVLPTALSAAFQPRTKATYPLVVWHELAHAFLSNEPVVRTPAWLREFLPQALSAATALGAGIPLGEYLARIDRRPSFTVRNYRGRVDTDGQMAFQNLLLSLGAAAVEEFGEGFLGTLAHALWEENGVVDEGRAEELLADALGPDGRQWLTSRPEF